MYTKRTLFYPCSGGDIHTPIRAFAAIVDEFWFVDINAYIRRVPNSRGQCREPDASSTWELVPDECSVQTQTCQHKKFNKTLTLNFVTGDGKVAFDQLYSSTGANRQLSVFFHRGDSQGEGGSNVYWLKPTGHDDHATGLLHEVLTTIQSPGIICSDGSNACDSLARYFNASEPEADTHLHIDPFAIEGSNLTPIGTLDTKYGPTVVWQVTRD